MKLTEIAPDWIVDTPDKFHKILLVVHEKAYDCSWVYGRGRPAPSVFSQRFFWNFFKHFPTEVTAKDSPDEVIWKRAIKWGREHAKEIDLVCPRENV